MNFTIFLVFQLIAGSDRQKQVERKVFVDGSGYTLPNGIKHDGTMFGLVATDWSTLRAFYCEIVEFVDLDSLPPAQIEGLIF